MNKRVVKVHVYTWEAEDYAEYWKLICLSLGGSFKTVSVWVLLSAYWLTHFSFFSKKILSTTNDIEVKRTNSQHDVKIVAKYPVNNYLWWKVAFCRETVHWSRYHFLWWRKDWLPSLKIRTISKKLLFFSFVSKNMHILRICDLRINCEWIRKPFVICKKTSVICIKVANESVGSRKTQNGLHLERYISRAQHSYQHQFVFFV